MSKIDLNRLPVVEESPLQATTIHFPQRLFGKKNPKKRSFQQAWYKSYPWLQYDSSRDVCFCHTCVKALKGTKIQPNGNIELAFTSKIFTIGKMLKSHSETAKIVRHIGNLSKCYIPCQERPRISEKLCPKATPMRRKRTGDIC